MSILRPDLRTLALLLPLAAGLGACETTGDSTDGTVTDDDDLLTDTDDTDVSDTDGGGDTGDTDDGGGQSTTVDLSSVPLPDPADFDYATTYTFQIDDVVGGFDGVRQADDGTIVCTTGCDDMQHPKTDAVMYPVDNAFGFEVQDFVGAESSPRDGIHDDGWVGPITDDMGAHIGLRISSVETKTLKTGYPLGRWCAGLGADLEKCSSEHYVSMENTLTCHETVPYLLFDPATGDATDPVWEACAVLDDTLSQPIADLTPYEDDLTNLAIGDDYSVSKKEDGKPLYHWGTWDKRPTDMRLTAVIPLPDEWKSGDTVYEVTRAELAILHSIGNSPNDQIRPEDYENEAATGRLPTYEVQADGSWTSTKDCYMADGTFIPTGTLFKNPAFADPTAATEDLQEGFTNAWYTSLDRDPFEADPVSGSGPRWRLQAPKFGQDIPGIEIPTDNCAPQPIERDLVKYSTGNLTATVIDMLDWEPGEESPLALSTGWTTPGSQDFAPGETHLTVNGVQLTEDLDLSVYVKGESKPMELYQAVLYLDYAPVD